MTIFQILIKCPEMIVSGCYIAQNDRNLHMTPYIKIKSWHHMRNISNLQKKKLEGTKMSKKIFVIFWFCAICGQIKSCLILKIFSTKKIYRNLRKIIRKSFSKIFELWNTFKMTYVTKCDFWDPSEWRKNLIFKSLIKWPEMVVFGSYIAQNDRN